MMGLIWDDPEDVFPSCSLAEYGFHQPPNARHGLIASSQVLSKTILIALNAELQTRSVTPNGYSPLCSVQSHPEKRL